MANKESLFAGLHILMRAIPDGPVDAGRRFQRYWYRESRCQVRTGWQKQNPRKSVQSVANEIFFVPKPVRRSWFLRSLWRSRTAKADVFVVKTPRLNISSCSSCLRGEKIREISVNPWLINYLYAFGIFTTVVSALQISSFMQNEPNFRKSQMNVYKVLTRDYGNKTLGENGKNEPKTNPNEPKTNPIYPVVASGEVGSNPISKAVKCCCA